MTWALWIQQSFVALFDAFKRPCVDSDVNQPLLPDMQTPEMRVAAPLVRMKTTKPLIPTRLASPPTDTPRELHQQPQSSDSDAKED
jgi:hypothetical protein